LHLVDVLASMMLQLFVIIEDYSLAHHKGSARNPLGFSGKVGTECGGKTCVAIFYS
jgi:hypothetical protein